MTVNLQLLSDDDLAGITSWCEPFARMKHPAVAAWGNQAWHACVDEKSRRDGGAPAVTPWPPFDTLPTEALVLISQTLSLVHDAGSDVLRVWVEETGELIVNALMARMDPDE